MIRSEIDVPQVLDFLFIMAILFLLNLIQEHLDTLNALKSCNAL